MMPRFWGTGGDGIVGIGIIFAVLWFILMIVVVVAVIIGVIYLIRYLTGRGPNKQDEAMEILR